MELHVKWIQERGKERERIVYTWVCVCVRERERERECVFKSFNFKVRTGLNPASTPVTLGRLFKLSESQFTHLKNKSNDIDFLLFGDN